MADPIRTGRPGDATRWIWRGSALAVILIGWVFIAAKNNFHITPPVVFVALGYFAGVAAIYSLFRTGAAAVAGNPEDDGEATWGRPMGARGELEREKRTLLKAIKEAEFDHQMGKLSKRDADEMIATYRARAIEVIKEIDRVERASGGTGTVRERIQREVRARLEVEGKPSKKAAADLDNKKKKKGKGGDGKSESKSDSKAESKSDSKAESKSDSKSEAKGDSNNDSKNDSKADAKSDPKADANSDSKADAKSDSKAEAKGDSKNDSKSESKSDAKSESKSDAKSESKSDADAEDDVEAAAAAAAAQDESSPDVKEATP